MTTGDSNSNSVPKLCVAHSVACLALLLILTGCSSNPSDTQSTELYERVVEGNVFDTTPVYGEAQSLRLRRTGFEYKCSSCHTDFDHEITSNRPAGEHPEILARFDHGRTIYCLSCHNQNDRDAYTDNIGQPMSAEHSEQLCARCHGPKFRDWEAGIHGRTNGHWDEKYGERNKLTCTQCHDPHNPAFPDMIPSPPPPHSRLDTIANALHTTTEKESP